MIEFVDIKTGKVFDGGSPYVFWFEGGQSVNLNYVNKICFISEYPSVTASIDSPVFSILNLGQDIPINMGDLVETINSKEFIDINRLKVSSCPMIGYQYGNIYVYILYILARSDEGGEIQDNFTISDMDGDHVFTVGADFYVDNELLINQLGNFDIHIPESIQKSIYDMDVHEEANDNILLNRKYKELLLNYWDIVANKGSYNSLQNSLAWFEWGDLVRIEEIWARHHEGINDYFSTILNRPLDQEFVDQFLNNSKTTYIGLYTALNHLTGTYADDTIPLQYSPGGRAAAVPGIGDWVCVEDPDAQTWVEVTDYTLPCKMIQVTAQTVSKCAGFQYIVNPNWASPDHTPDLGDTIYKWELIDIYLKMTLLGNFYSTFFMPVHMDLLHSVAERWVFAGLIKILITSITEQNAWVVRGRRCGMLHDENTYIRDHNNRPWSRQLFLGSGDVFGFCTDPVDEPDTSFNTSGKSLSYPLGGAYGVLHFSTDNEDPMLAADTNDVIYRQRVSWSGAYSGSQESWVVVLPEQNLTYDFSFDLAFRWSGEYNILFEFFTTSGNVWTYSCSVDIRDNTSNHIDMYIVQRLTDIERASLDIVGTDWEPWLRCFQMNPGLDSPLDHPSDPGWPNIQEVPMTGRDYTPYRYYHPYREHSIFVGDFTGSVGMNQTVIMDVASDDWVLLTNYDPIEHFDRLLVMPHWTTPDDAATDAVTQYLNGQLPEYIWIVIPHIDHITGAESGLIRIIGICRNYDVEPVSGLAFMNNDVLVDRQYLISLRFQPFMHKIVPFTNNEIPISADTLIYMEPHLGYSKELSISNWEFRNMTTQKSYTSYLTEMTFYPDGRNYGDFGVQVPGGMQSLVVAPQTKEHLDPGYYNIHINYEKESTQQQYSMDSAFIIAK